MTNTNRGNGPSGPRPGSDPGSSPAPAPAPVVQPVGPAPDASPSPSGSTPQGGTGAGGAGPSAPSAQADGTGGAGGNPPPAPSPPPPPPLGDPPVRTLDPDTILYTGWDYVASSCWLRVATPGATATEEPLYLGTTRHGFMYVTNPESMFPSTLGVHPHAYLDVALNGDPDALMRALMNFWQFGEPDLRSFSETVVHPIHFFSDRGPDLRPTYLRAPSLSEGLDYQVQMDWSFPYCLRLDGQSDSDLTMIYPFELKRSIVNGRLLNRTGDRHWNLPYSVRFRRSPNWDEDRCYITDVLREDGTAYGLPLSPRPPSRSDPAWMFVDGVPRPRLRLPHSRGFLLLHKLWLFMMEGYEHIQSFVLAQSNPLRTRYRLRSLRRMFEYAGQSNAPGSDGRRYASEAMKLIDTFSTENDRHDRDLERTYTSNSAAVFDYLVGFFGNESDWGCAESMRRDWYSFSHFLGPLTFLELAVWIIRQSPRAQDFYLLHGRSMLRPPTGRWVSGAQSDNSMIPDERFVEEPEPPEYVNDGISWSKRTLKTYAFVNQIFMYYHARELWFPTASRGVLRQNNRPGGRMSSFFPTLEDLTKFAEYLAQADGSDFVQRMDDWLQDRKLQSDVYHMAIFDDAADLTRRVDTIRFAHAQQFPHIAGCLDVLSSTLALAALDEAYRTSPGTFGWRQAFDTASELLGLTDTMATLAGLDGALFFRNLNKSLPYISIGVSTYDAYSAFAREDYYTGSLRSLQAVGAGAILASGYLGSSGVGATPAIVTFLSGTLVVIAADIAIWVHEHNTEPHQRYAGSLFEAICTDPPTVDHWDHLVRWPPNRVRYPLVRHLERFAERRQVWAKAEIDARTLKDDIDQDDTWLHFPVHLWRYLDLREASSRAAFQRQYHRGTSVDDRTPPRFPFRLPTPSSLPIEWP